MENGDIYLSEYLPRPAMTTQVSFVPKPRFPVIDAHNHLGSLAPGLDFSGGWSRRPVKELIGLMDELDIRAIVDLDGQWGDHLKREIARYQEPYPGRFVVFTGIDFDVFSTERDFGRILARRLREGVAAGARGLKVWKPLGLSLRDSAGELVPVNDRRLDELWEAAGELDVPVMIHVADPVAFFMPHDRFNERWEELSAHPEWHFPSPPFPSFMTIMDQFQEMVTRHRGTRFIGAHVGCYAENLKWVGAMMDKCPNFFVDIGARLGELGRQPYTAREFFISHADRILFGTDIGPDRATYQLHYRFMETRDEYFNYSKAERPPQGRWMIYGLYLPDDVLKKVYHDNAKKLLKI